MARQTPQQKRANAAFSKQNEKNMGRPMAAKIKKEAQKSPIGTGMLSMYYLPVLFPIFHIRRRLYPVVQNIDTH